MTISIRLTLISTGPDMIDIGAAFAMRNTLVRVSEELARVSKLVTRDPPHLESWNWQLFGLPEGVRAQIVETWRDDRQTITITRDFKDMIEFEDHHRLLVNFNNIPPER